MKKMKITKGSIICLTLLGASTLALTTTGCGKQTFSLYEIHLNSLEEVLNYQPRAFAESEKLSGEHYGKESLNYLSHHFTAEMIAICMAVDVVPDDTTGIANMVVNIQVKLEDFKIWISADSLTEFDDAGTYRCTEIYNNGWCPLWRADSDALSFGEESRDANRNSRFNCMDYGYDGEEHWDSSWITDAFSFRIIDSLITPGFYLEY